MNLYPIQFINRPTETEKRGTLLIIVMTRHHFVATRRDVLSFAEEFAGDWLCQWPRWPSWYLFIYYSLVRSLGKGKDGRIYEYACDTMLSLRGGRHHITDIVMGPPLVSKIGCRATTFQTTRDSYELITSIRERRKIPPSIVYLYCRT